MNRRRAVWLQLGWLLCFIVMLTRLWWLQVIGVHPPGLGARSVIPASVWQRGQGVVLDSGRGHFLDRELRPLTGDPYLTLVVFPHSGAAGGDEAIARLADILGIAPEEWSRRTNSLAAPFFWHSNDVRAPVRLSRAEADAIDALGIPGVTVAPYMGRYFPDAPAAQLLGYIGENPSLLSELYATELAEGAMRLSGKLGASGLERTFDSYLQAGDPTTLSVRVDGKRQLLEHPALRIYEPDNPFLPLDIVTTLDRQIQRELEAILDGYRIEEGAAVILDARNGDIAAMSSRPRFDPSRVDPEQPGWSNRAVKAAVPGSVFKLVIAAAALEYGVVADNEPFFCPGEYGKYGLSCWKREGHGRLTLREAFAQSCNVAFATVSERLTAEQIVGTARRLGLDRTAGWSEASGDASFHQLDGEETGTIFAASVDTADPGVLAQTAIGQRDVRLSPLQAANLVLTVLNGGRAASPRAVSAVRYRNGVELKSFPARTLVAPADGISAATANRLKRWMRDVVTSGTGSRLQAAAWPLAGKSGTAQVPHASGEGENEWFVGFGPAEQPRYAVAVMVHKSRSDTDHAAVRLFGDIMDMLSAL